MTKNEKNAVWFTMDYVLNNFYDEMKEYISSDSTSFQDALYNFCHKTAISVIEVSSEELKNYVEQ